MPSIIRSHRTGSRFGGSLGISLIVIAASAAFAANASADSTDEGFSGGIEARPSASAADIGLPIYPGAVPQRDRGDDKSAVTLGLWGGSFGFKLIVAKFASDDKLDAVASYYRDALGRYGSVLDCSQPSAKGQRSTDKNALNCDNDNPGPGERLYKVGNAKAQRIVSMKRVGDGVHFQMVRMEAKGS